MYPLIDDYMTYNYEDHRYVLTPKFIFDNYGFLLEDMLNDSNAASTLLNMISVQVYNHIHKYNANNDLQDFIIAKTSSGRQIIKNAMEQQFLLVATVGDKSRLLEEARRDGYIDINAQDCLCRTIKEIGAPIIYSGTLRLCSSVDNSEW